MSGYGAAPYGGTSGAYLTAADSFSISDSAMATQGRFSGDSWAVTDIVPARVSFVRPTSDGFAISDAASRAVGGSRGSSDSFTITDGARVFWAPYVDLPKLLWIRPATKSLALRPGGSLAIEDAAKTLVLEDATKELVLDG